MNTPPEGFFAVASLSELQSNGVMMVRGADRPVALCLVDGQVRAVDDRCPHLGFPLHKGTVKDGVLTCHWHHARFDLCSGCAFDLFADDVPSFATLLEKGTIYLARRPSFEANREYFLKRLKRGLEQTVPLVQAKSIVGLMTEPDSERLIAECIADFGTTHHEEWNDGMTTLAVAINLLPFLSRESATFAFACAARRVAENCRASPAPRERGALLGSEASVPQLKRWFRHWLRGRERDGAERTLLTAVKTGAESSSVEDLLFDAINDRVYSADGHTLDFTNKACELINYLGWTSAERMLQILLPQLARARGADEANAWRDPIDLIALVREAEAALPEWESGVGRRPAVSVRVDLVDVLLKSEAEEIVAALRNELLRGVPAQILTQWVAYAAARRLAHFPDTNDGNDWFFPMHAFSYASAVHRSVGRTCTAGTVRGLFHAALAIYQDRFLNVPSARMPGEKLPTDAISENAEVLLQQLPSKLDQVGNMTEFATYVAGYVRSGHPLPALVNAMAMMVLREDVDFHHLQVLEAGVQQAQLWWGRPEAEHILVGVARSFAAHCPTRRTAAHITRTALRLHRGEAVAG